jgi:hypothetical protein
MYIAKLKDGPKRAKQTCSMILERIFEMVWWRVENGITSKRIFLNLKCFSPLRILTPPLFEETLGAFIFLPFFFFQIMFSLFSFYAPSLDDLGVLMIFEEKNHFFRNFIFKWNGMVMTVDILAVDAYSGMGLCTPI